MKITATSSGGFAGRTDSYQLDTECSADGKSVEDLLQRLDFFGAAPPCGVGADIPRWEITVDDGPRRHTVTLMEDGNASAIGWQSLLEHLRRSA
jgi:hypothetical protein